MIGRLLSYAEGQANGETRGWTGATWLCICIFLFPLIVAFFSLQGNSTFTEFPDCTLTIHTFNKYRCKYAHPYVHENTS